ncbi:hypothetical protein OIU92_20905 [Escherichia coli]|nr:hypothetical protein [Escherichia coli]
MVNLALWLKSTASASTQVQNFYPSPLANRHHVLHRQKPAGEDWL